MESITQDSKGHCATCGKEITVRDVRNRKAEYCSRICAANARFATRYRGTMAGPADRPDMLSKTKFTS